MKIGILQQNYVVGDCAGNAKKIIEGYHKLCAMGAELVVGSELAILGYPPKDLLESSSKIYDQLNAFELIRLEVGEIGLIIGVAEPNRSFGKPLFNNGVLIRNHKFVNRRTKELLPTYDVFDESRYFQPGPEKTAIFTYNAELLSLLVCEDTWGGTENPNGQKLYKIDPVENLRFYDPSILVVINASPYYWGKGDVRLKRFSAIAKKLNCALVYVNQVGGNDELIFDGRSFGVSKDGVCIGAAKSFEEDLIIIDTENTTLPPDQEYVSDTENLEELRRALVLGVRDYLRKTEHTQVVIGESGGVDSALTTCLAVDAVGSENVTAITMPGPFSSLGSVADSAALCKNLGVRLELASISALYNAFGDTVGNIIGWKGPGDFGDDVTEENVQARIRGMILMAFSNRKRKEGKVLVLSTGNKSEFGVGFCTLYGDMVGGLAVISDLPKTLVYRLAKYYNEIRDGVIPTSIIVKEPSAELRPDQIDSNSLPPYDILDEILRLHVEEGLDEGAIIAHGLPEASVSSVLSKVRNNEHKRKQAPIGLKVTTKAFGSGRRLPIATKATA